MCTVSFIPSGKKVFIASNRDEHVLRKSADLPVTYPLGNGMAVFPKDGEAGGTWIGMHSKGHVMVLLNGAFKKHKHEPPYLKSRGLIFLEILDAINPQHYFGDMLLDGIEPFTLVLWQHPQLWELRWDGNEKHIAQPDPSAPHIWSSATLYGEEIVRKREAWFDQWLERGIDKNKGSIIEFHSTAGDGDHANDLLMNRGNMLQTISITAIEWAADNAVMIYQDLVNGTNKELELSFE